MANWKKWTLWGGSIAVTVLGGYLVLFLAGKSSEEIAKIIVVLNTIFLVGGFALSCFMLFRFHLLRFWSGVLQFIFLLWILRVLYAQFVWWVLMDASLVGL